MRHKKDNFSFLFAFDRDTTRIMNNISETEAEVHDDLIAILCKNGVNVLKKSKFSHQWIPDHPDHALIVTEKGPNRKEQTFWIEDEGESKGVRVYKLKDEAKRDWHSFSKVVQAEVKEYKLDLKDAGYKPHQVDDLAWKYAKDIERDAEKQREEKKKSINESRRNAFMKKNEKKLGIAAKGIAAPKSTKTETKPKPKPKPKAKAATKPKAKTTTKPKPKPKPKAKAKTTTKKTTPKKTGSNKKTTTRTKGGKKTTPTKQTRTTAKTKGRKAKGTILSKTVSGLSIPYVIEDGEERALTKSNCISDFTPEVYAKKLKAVRKAIKASASARKGKTTKKAAPKKPAPKKAAPKKAAPKKPTVKQTTKKGVTKGSFTTPKKPAAKKKGTSKKVVKKGGKKVGKKATAATHSLEDLVKRLKTHKTSLKKLGKAEDEAEKEILKVVSLEIKRLEKEIALKKK